MNNSRLRLTTVPLAENDWWKEKFLEKISAEFNSKLLIEDRKYRVIGVPSFYNEKAENAFRADLGAALTAAKHKQ